MNKFLQLLDSSKLRRRGVHNFASDRDDVIAICSPFLFLDFGFKLAKTHISLVHNMLAAYRANKDSRARHSRAKCALKVMVEYYQAGNFKDCE